MTNKTSTASTPSFATLGAMPRWFRALAADVAVYAPAWQPLVRAAQGGDCAAYDACRRYYDATR